MQTWNDVKSDAKKASVEVLNARLAGGVDLALLTKQARWNIKGPQFIALHEMIDAFRTQRDTHVDAMAERAVQLGATALGASQIISAATKIAPYPTDRTEHCIRRPSRVVARWAKRPVADKSDAGRLRPSGSRKWKWDKGSDT